MLETYKIADETHIFDPANIRHIAEVLDERSRKSIVIQLEGVPMPIIITPKIDEYDEFFELLCSNIKNN